MAKEDYENLYGFWHVTTSGDCEGRTTRDLGVHEGWVDDIAFAFAHKAMYDLTFERVNPVDWSMNNENPKADEVHVRFNIDSGTWDLKGDDLVDWAANVFKDRPCHVLRSNYFSAFALSKTGKTVKEEKEVALSKLTHREKKILNLI